MCNSNCFNSVRWGVVAAIHHRTLFAGSDLQRQRHPSYRKTAAALLVGVSLPPSTTARFFPVQIYSGDGTLLSEKPLQLCSLGCRRRHPPPHVFRRFRSATMMGTPQRKTAATLFVGVPSPPSTTARFFPVQIYSGDGTLLSEKPLQLCSLGCRRRHPPPHVFRRFRSATMMGTPLNEKPLQLYSLGCRRRHPPPHVFFRFRSTAAMAPFSAKNHCNSVRWGVIAAIHHLTFFAGSDLQR
uniref:Uncharacterized protein n=1 Tax=Nelumbo nucifera TaxID=4432 RepID=A0A822XQ80_NELNU|nr:TPA_asm: hypothetical protein HUJ06_023950 [Nelumbo nucifera]